jgi:hypothetical protein
MGRRSRTRGAGTALVVAVLGGGACSSHGTIDTSVLVHHADALWGGIGGFCARTPQGLTCWTKWRDRLSGPTLVPDLVGVTDVAVGAGRACALASGAVACVHPGGAAIVARIPLDHPAQLVEVDALRIVTCARDAAGVACWSDEPGTPVRVPQLGAPQRMFTSIDHSLCGSYDDGVRCSEPDIKGNFGPALAIENAKAPTAIDIDTIGGGVFVLEDGVVEYGRFAGTLHVTGNAFAAKDPLDVAATVTPFVGARVKVEPIPGLGHVTALVSRLFPIALDDRGLARLDSGHLAAVKTRPTEAVPSALWDGARAEIYTREGDALHQYLPQTHLVIPGVRAPTAVIATLSQTCALAADGDVTCWDSPDEHAR